MPFRDVAGHHHAVSLLARAVARESLPPSLIFAGPEGVGKRRVAIALAQALNCLQPVAFSGRGAASEGGDGAGVPRSLVASSLDACGTCSSCRRIEKGIHPDVLMVGIEADASSIKVEQAREVSERAAYRPYEGKRRVVIVDPADAMERYAQNALLKLLEEPPPATVLVLVTSQADVLLPTVRSRCPQVRFGALSEGEIAEILVRECELTPEEARAAAIVSSGSVTRAMEAASEEAGEARSKALAVLRQAASVRDRRALMEQMRVTIGVEKRQASAAAEREQVSLTLRAMTSLLRDLLVLDQSRDRGSGIGGELTESRGSRGSGIGGELANADLRGDLEQLSRAFGYDRVMRAFAAVDRSLSAIRGNASSKLVVDWLAHNV